MTMTEDEFADFVVRPDVVRYLQGVTKNMQQSVLPEARQDAMLRTWKYVSKPSTVIETDMHLMRVLAKTLRWAYIDRLKVEYSEQAKFQRDAISLDVPFHPGEELGDRYGQIPDPRPDPAEVSYQQHVSPELVSAIDTLTEDQKNLVLRAWIQGESQASLAREMGIAERTMGSRIQRIRTKLQKALVDA